MCNAQAPPVVSGQVEHQLSTIDLLERISDLTSQLNDRDARIEELSSTLKALNTSRHSSVCDHHIKPRKRTPNSIDMNRVLLPQTQEDPPAYEEPTDPLLPPHFSETWLYDMKYQDELREAYMSDVDPFFVLAENDFADMLASEPLTSTLKLKQFSLKDETKPYDLLAFYGVFLGDTAYSKELDSRLHEIMQTIAARWEVQTKAMRYMVWNDDIEDERIESDSETCHAEQRGEIRYQIYQEAGLVRRVYDSDW